MPPTRPPELNCGRSLFRATFSAGSFKVVSDFVHIISRTPYANGRGGGVEARSAMQKSFVVVVVIDDCASEGARRRGHRFVGTSGFPLKWSRGTLNSFRKGLLPLVRPQIQIDGFRIWPWRRSIAKRASTGCLVLGHDTWRSSLRRLFRFRSIRGMVFWAEPAMEEIPRQSP